MKCLVFSNTTIYISTGLVPPNYNLRPYISLHCSRLLPAQTMDPTPLVKPNPFAYSTYRSAYQRCLDLESSLLSLDVPGGLPRPQISARVLGHLLRLAPNDNARVQVSQEINSATDEDGLMVLAYRYVFNFIRVFKRVRGPTPPPSRPPSQQDPSEKDRYFWRNLIEESNVGHYIAKNAALQRDAYRCVITGKYDLKSYLENPSDIGCLPINACFTTARAAHIVPPRLNTHITGEEEAGERHEHTRAEWTMLSVFGHPDVANELTGNKIHRLENIITLSQNIHNCFDNLWIWLKPIEGSPNQYTLHGRTPQVTQNMPQTITLSTTNPDFPLPSCDYLALHALCCEITWLSGAGEYLEAIQLELEETRSLASDGSMAYLLSSALLPLEDP